LDLAGGIFSTLFFILRQIFANMKETREALSPFLADVKLEKTELRRFPPDSPINASTGPTTSPQCRRMLNNHYVLINYSI
jgi:hypothetical protein